ncbi:ATP-binding protein [Microbulbifer sp. OS29]|uniref:ATP-binding protein n=1 Tax=Microbulbifer okhotskensis TaxID=2926617 RepID=A0A9X2EQI1_9GAMM|nr:ATP-binding protein [Microbulbifer okhotskensis]MCO1335964.1 ATP-binding protein [Microbulbifer okhotskensis]
MKKYGTLVLFCGKMGAGKSTKAAEISEKTGAILISEDEWLSRLYPGEINSLQDYIKYSPRLKSVIEKHVQSILYCGVSVIMDFPGNTKQQRSWLKGIFLNRPYHHQLIYLDADDDTCLKQIAHRKNSQPERTEIDTPSIFKQVTKYFEAPSADEGFNIETIKLTCT